MYTKEEAAKIKGKFWKKFGQYMAPVPAADGLLFGMNWINYRTGIKGLQFKMNVDYYQATVSITIMDKDPIVQALLWDRLLEMKLLLQNYITEDWVWYDDAWNDYGQSLKKLEIVLENVNVYREDDWSRIIPFLKENIMTLDAFWAEYGFLFDEYKF